jgi:hypothetical protein
MFTPKPYQSISELLGVMGNLLIVGSRTTDERFQARFLQLFDVVFRGLTLYLDKEFYQAGPNVPVPLERIGIDKKTLFAIQDVGELPTVEEFDIEPPPDLTS